MTARVKGKSTFRFVAVMFLLSAVFELYSIASPAPLLGAYRGGAAIVVYHVLYTALYAALGVGLWKATGWGYTLVFVVTAVYTLDKLQYVFFGNAVLDGIANQLGQYRDVLQAVDRSSLLQALRLAALGLIAGWWGFALYTYLRRSYFGK
jgi:hypothetical protein